jgi:Holliday junction resolvase RusA-like endonuclease
MIPVKTTVIPIQPVTYMRTLHTEYWILSSKDEYIDAIDERRLQETGKRGRLLSRKRQLERFVGFKEDIRKWLDQNDFKMPHGYFAAWFYLPVHESWREKKRTEMLYTIHQSTPDCDNLIKSLLDAIMPRRNRKSGEKGPDDRKVHCYAAFKMWVRPEEACIKIIEYDDIEFMRAFEHGLPYLR